MWQTTLDSHYPEECVKRQDIVNVLNRKITDTLINTTRKARHAVRQISVRKQKLHIGPSLLLLIQGCILNKNTLVERKVLKKRNNRIYVAWLNENCDSRFTTFENCYTRTGTAQEFLYSLSIASYVVQITYINRNIFCFSRTFKVRDSHSVCTVKCVYI